MITIFDALILLLAISSLVYGYKHGGFTKLYPFLKLFFGFMVAGKYALFIGIQLSSMGILKATSFALLLLIGFGAAFGIYWLIVTGLEFLAKKVNTARITKPLGALIVFVQTTLLVAFYSLF